MSSADLEPLSAEAERLLAEERDVPPAPAELRARAMARARAASSAAGVRPLRRTFRSRVTLLVAATLALAFAAVSFAAWRDRAPRSATSAPPSGTASSRGITTAEPPARAPEPAVPEAPGPAPPQLRNDVEVEPTARRTATEDPTAVELKVLQRARAAVAKREFSAALDLVAEHQRRFPNGKLKEEREALRVKALAGLGRTEEARQAAELFRERFPNSVLSPRIEATARPAP